MFQSNRPGGTSPTPTPTHPKPTERRSCLNLVQHTHSTHLRGRREGEEGSAEELHHFENDGVMEATCSNYWSVVGVVWCGVSVSRLPATSEERMGAIETWLSTAWSMLVCAAARHPVDWLSTTCVRLFLRSIAQTCAGLPRPAGASSPLLGPLLLLLGESPKAVTDRPPDERRSK